MNYDLITTLGPATATEAAWQQLLEAGATAFRLNTSHLSLHDTLQWLERLRSFRAQPGLAIPVTLDLQGSKWRLGEFPACELAEGSRIDLTESGLQNRPGVLPVPHHDFFRAAALHPGDIVLNDGRVVLATKKVTADRVMAEVIRGGAVSSRKGITIAGCPWRHEGFSARDRAIVAATSDFPGISYAISCVRDVVEMTAFRREVRDCIPVIAKLERAPALADAAEIAAVANRLWLCRGDLGAELGEAEMARTASRFTTSLTLLKTPAIVAGQVLQHMVDHPDPTRAEVCGLYDALQNGYAGIVLSDETAIGRYPLAACRAAAMFRGNEF